MRNPLVPVTAAFAAGIWAAPRFFLSASEQIFFLTLIVLGSVALLTIRQHGKGLFLALLGFFLCGVFLAAEERAVLPPQHVESLVARGLVHPAQPLQVTGWARTASVEHPKGQYFDLELTQVRQQGLAVPAEGVIRLNSYHYDEDDRAATPDFRYGTRLSFPLKALRSPRNFLTPGSYDWAGYMRRQGIYFTGILPDRESIETLPGRAGSLHWFILSQIRSRLLSHIDRLFPPNQDSAGKGPILKAILLGDRQWLSEETGTIFQEGGTYHALVVSGLHVGALAAGLFWMLSRIRLPDWLVTLLVIGCVAAFTLLAGARIPVVRAALMVLIYLLARLVYRQRALLNSIAAAGLILLVLHPSDLRDSGFQLSFLAVLVIAVIAVPFLQWTISPYRQAVRGLDEKEKDALLKPNQAQFRQDLRTLLDYFCDPSLLQQRRFRMIRRFLLLFATILLTAVEAAVFIFFIQIGLALSTAVFFHRTIWLGIAANVLVIPLMGILVPFGFCVLLASLLWWPASVLGAKFLGILVSLLLWIMDWVVSLPWGEGRIPSPPTWISACFIALLLLMAVFVERRSRFVAHSVAVLILFGVLLSIAPYSPRLPDGRLEVTFLDVGQGDSLFVAFPEGSTMLVDGGGSTLLDVGEQVVSPYLWSRRLKAIDYLVLTHAHHDHLDGLRSVLRNFSVRELWIGSGPSSRQLENLLEIAASRSVRVVRQQAGGNTEIDGVEVLFLSPPDRWNPKTAGNNDSIVLRLGYGRRHILLPGDVGSSMERRMVKAGLPIASDVLKIPHHGSKTSTTAEFLNQIGPRFGILSVGPYRRYNHPDGGVLDRLQRAGVRTYRTDRDGSITVSTDGTRIELETFRSSVQPWAPFKLQAAHRFPVGR